MSFLEIHIWCNSRVISTRTSGHGCTTRSNLDVGRRHMCFIIFSLSLGA